MHIYVCVHIYVNIHMQICKYVHMCLVKLLKTYVCVWGGAGAGTGAEVCASVCVGGWGGWSGVTRGPPWTGASRCSHTVSTGTYIQ